MRTEGSGHVLRRSRVPALLLFGPAGGVDGVDMDLADRRRRLNAARVSRSQVARVVQGAPVSFCEQPRRTPSFARWLAAADCRTATAAAAPRSRRRDARRRQPGSGIERGRLVRRALSGRFWPAFRIRRRCSGFAAIPAVLARAAVAIVGSRAATDYALRSATRLGSELAERGIVVTSGLARGVDSAAHAGCLGRRAPRLPSSAADWIGSIRRSTRIWRQVFAEQGALVSELGPGAPPLPEHFPLRNRIISGISLAVVVVEASEKSGSLITARYALEQGRDVMAVPGSVLRAGTAAPTAC